MTTNTDTTAASGAASLGALQAELAGAEIANNHLSAMVDELRALLAHAMRVMKELHSAAKPDEEQEDCPPIISAEAFARFVNQNSALRYAIHKSGHDLPTTPALAAPAAQPCQTCADRADGFYGSYAPDCPTHTAAPAAQEAEPAPHSDDIAVDRFAAAMKDKLAAARAKGRGGWETNECTQDRLSQMLREHVDKGDPRDVANFCAFLWNRGESIATSAPRPQADAGAVPAVDREKLIDVIADGLRGTWHCTRVWEAWHIGTMSQDDFAPVDESETPSEIADAVLSLLAAAPQAPAAPTADGEPPAVPYAQHERDLQAEVDQREQAEHVIDLLCDAVLGPDRQEWSSAYGYQSAINDVAERIAELEHKAAPAPAAPMSTQPVHHDSTPGLRVGDSSFDHWFQQQPFATQTGVKQIARDAYAAGMGDPLVVPAVAPAAGAAPTQHITEPYTVAEIRERVASGDYSAELMLQHAMLHLGAVAGAAPTDAAIDALLDSSATMDWHLADNIRSRMRMWTRMVLARWGAASSCGGVPDPRCSYLATCGQVCNKCGKVHQPTLFSTTGAAAPAQEAEDAARYRWLRDETEWEPFDSAWLHKMDIYGCPSRVMDAAIDAARARLGGGA